MKQRAKITIIASALALLSCTGVALGVSLAYFTSDASSNVHLYAGNLDASMVLTSVSHFSYPGVVTSENASQYPDLEIGDIIVEDNPYVNQELYNVIDSNDSTLYLTNVGGSGKNGIDFGSYSGSINIRNAFPSETYTVKFVMYNPTVIPFTFTVGTRYAAGKKADNSVISASTTEALFEDEILNVPTTAVVPAGASQEFSVNFTLLECDSSYMGAMFSIDVYATCTQIVID